MTIIYFGPITPKGKQSNGGYAAANRKNIDMLTELGINTIEIPKPTKNKFTRNFGLLINLCCFLQPFLLFKYIFRKDVIVHITPVYKFFTYPAALTVFISWLLRIPVLTDLRAGTFIKYYKEYSSLYRWANKIILNKSTAITVESKYYIEEIKKIIKNKDKTISYFPNVANCDELNFKVKQTDTYKIFYFGRITSNKGIDIMLETVKMLDNRFTLYLAGPVANDIDINSIENDKTKYLGLLKSDEIKEILKETHFFIFPTRHEGEGQSNALIEAMSEGVIPIAYNQGFCAEVISDCGTILPTNATAKEFTSAILSYCNENYNDNSYKAQQHIKTHHNLRVEIKKIIKIYKEIL